MRKTFDEPLKYCTDQYWLKRYEVACDTSRALSDHREVVLDAAEPWQAWLYEKLINQVDGYVDQLKQYLLLECKFEFDEKDGIDFARPRALTPVAAPPNLSIVCERRCKEVRHVVFCLSSADGVPVLSESLAFAKLKKSQFYDKKRLVHSKGLRIDLASLGLRSAEDLARCAGSVWDFDRIMFYKACETEPTTPFEMIGLVGHELEKVQAEEEASKMALHYSIKTLVRTIREASSDSFDSREALRLMDDVQKFLNRSGSEDDDLRIRRNVTDILEILATRRARDAVGGESLYRDPK